jgi:hypothetical protein
MRAFAIVALLAAGAGCVKSEKGKPAEACLAAVACYFGEDADPQHHLGLVLKGLGAEDVFRSTYGKDGSCWIGDDAELRHSCEDRCRGLLWQDCHQPYVDDVQHPGEPFCKDTVDGGTELVACHFPEECSDNGSRSVCPAPTTCSAPPKADDAKESTFGCCVPPDGGVDGCAYENPDPVDDRCPAGAASGATSCAADAGP